MPQIPQIGKYLVSVLIPHKFSRGSNKMENPRCQLLRNSRSSLFGHIVCCRWNTRFLSVRTRKYYSRGCVYSFEQISQLRIQLARMHAIFACFWMPSQTLRAVNLPRAFVQAEIDLPGRKVDGATSPSKFANSTGSPSDPAAIPNIRTIWIITRGTANLNGIIIVFWGRSF